jgi:hypothetical protein
MMEPSTSRGLETPIFSSFERTDSLASEGRMNNHESRWSALNTNLAVGDLFRGVDQERSRIISAPLNITCNLFVLEKLAVFLYF